MSNHPQERRIVIVVPDIRSMHNVGSILRTAEGLGIELVYLCGYTPHPAYDGDPRLPHLRNKQTSQIAKTALGAELSNIWKYKQNVIDVITNLKTNGYEIWALEQANNSVELTAFSPPSKLVLVLGSEVEGLDQSLIDVCKGCLEIPMLGKKESFNVVEAATMAMYHCRFN